MSDPWSPANPWGHDPEVCGTMDCPGCYAAAYVPPARQTLAEHLDEVYCTKQPHANGDREEDTEAGVSRRDAEADFYTNDGR